MSGSSSSVIRNAGLMSLATFISRIMGLVREQAFAFLFGAGNATDAFNVAFRIPNLLRDLFAEGAMSATLVPTFTQERTKSGERRAWRLAGLVFRVLFALVSLLALLGIVFAPELVGLYASAYREIPGKFELTVSMTQVIFPFFPCVALAAAFMGVLNACGVFFLPAFASALFNVASVAVGVVASFLAPKFGREPIEGMALGVVVGGAVQAFCQLPALYRKGYRWQPRVPDLDPPWHRDPALRKMLWMMIPGTIGLAATQVNILVNTILATSQGTGAVSWLGYAFRLMQFPIGVFGVSLAAATLPRVSKLWVDRDLSGTRETLQASLRNVFAVNLPASAGLAFLGLPIIQLIFEYGRFTPEDTAATALALAAYSVGLTAYSVVKVLVPACYALGNTRVPVISSMVAVAVNILLNLAIVQVAGFWGLAFGTSITAVLNSLFLLVAIRKLLGNAGGDFPVLPLMKSFLAHAGAALIMGAVCWLSFAGLEQMLPDAWGKEVFGRVGVVFFRALKVSLLICEGIVCVLGLAHLLDLRETKDVVSAFARKIKKKLS